ncbi:type I methionyl aminopeptidase [Helicobacter cetorum]|uniref:Methionine aminopeptidase n=1 Tax=Helicobacter cetorum (strain ATCC BAA-429 / MIT 00-7128) TaxID=182217 RepID=I0EKF3_HELC0|nr:type I methionyl aminopeptidase [Helicobacter cetorum]AFI03422.1 methionine aminopeptidase [Helicobacter cetorum MIT 00-7128]
MAISIKSPKEISALRKAGEFTGRTLALLKENVRVGITLLELDKIAEDFILSLGAKPAFKGLYGFPNTVCISVNEVVIHGIPTDYALKEGDIVGLDLGVEFQGYYGDSALTLPVGNISSKDKALLACSKETLEEAISSIKVGMHFKELSQVLEKAIIERGFVPLKGFCGHGIGRKPHEEPEIPNYLEKGVKPSSGPKIKEGMVFCLEPMVCQQKGEPKILQDKWSVISVDGLNTSHHEHTIAIVGNQAVILTEY